MQTMPTPEDTHNNPPATQPTPITRRTLLGAGVASYVALAHPRLASAQVVEPTWDISKGRPPLAQRKFTSDVIEKVIADTRPAIADPELARMFAQCFPNTLDTTLETTTVNGVPDTYLVSGDINAMWLRDSSAEVWPYLAYARQDPKLKSALEGIVRRHTMYVLRDPYANGFRKNEGDPPLVWSLHDKTKMLPGVAERKWEIDSLCYVIRLAYAYWKATGDTAPFDQSWHTMASTIVRTFRDQQRKDGNGPYSFMRPTTSPNDTLGLRGYGNPTRPVGLIHSGFRPSDDACIYPFLIPSNLFAVHQLKNLSAMLRAIYNDETLAADADSLRTEVWAALQKYGMVEHPKFGRIWAYEVDGFGNALMMDDANAPGLLSIGYLGCAPIDAVYANTRRFVLSQWDPYFFSGKYAEGIGGPHHGMQYIWPMAITIRALSSNSNAEIATCLVQLRDTTDGTGFMHESFHKDNPADYTRPWFSWANTLFGELILTLVKERPSLLKTTLPAWHPGAEPATHT
jgi:meiotically up-regulated gene 157 (Mug157) protein